MGRDKEVSKARRWMAIFEAVSPLFFLVGGLVIVLYGVHKYALVIAYPLLALGHLIVIGFVFAKTRVDPIRDVAKRAARSKLSIGSELYWEQRKKYLFYSVNNSFEKNINSSKAWKEHWTGFIKMPLFMFSFFGIFIWLRPSFQTTVSILVFCLIFPVLIFIIAIIGSKRERMSYKKYAVRQIKNHLKKAPEPRKHRLRITKKWTCGITGIVLSAMAVGLASVEHSQNIIFLAAALIPGIIFFQTGYELLKWDD